MIKHIVCFKLKDNSPENCQKAKEVLLSMQGNVPLLRGIEVGVDFLHSVRSYDVIQQVLLDDAAALEGYQNDPYHCD
ncbi:MAG: Dabb family protein, partial [Oscillospiraceae bacterium]|nr:Dabb family protein [Oscillospiraceae bacterium]